jgi:hypothetical protein
MSRLTRIALGLEPELLERIDAQRGDVPRERFIRKKLEAATGFFARPESEVVPPDGRSHKSNPAMRPSVARVAPRADRLPIGHKERVMATDGKSGAPLLTGWNVVVGHAEGGAAIWKFEERKL